jgi:hypothetical protein
MEPSVKGTIFSNVASELYELLAEGKLREEQFAALIKPDEREFLIESGRRSARKVIELGIYAQLDGPHRGGVGESHRTHSR